MRKQQLKLAMMKYMAQNFKLLRRRRRYPLADSSSSIAAAAETCRVVVTCVV